MVERSAVDTFVHDLENTLYDLVGKAVGVVEDLATVVAGIVEDTQTPVYNINVDTSVVEPENIAKWIREYRERNGLPIYDNLIVEEDEPQDETGGSDIEGTPLSRENLLRELYKYAAKHSDVFVDWEQDYEDWNATQASGHDIDRLLDSVKAALQGSVR